MLESELQRKIFMRFITIAEFIDAVQFWPENKPWPENVKVSLRDFQDKIYSDEDGKPALFYYFDGKESAYQIFPGYWIITNESGYQWAWDTETLKKRFRPVDDCPDWDLPKES